MCIFTDFEYDSDSIIWYQIFTYVYLNNTDWMFYWK